MLQGPMVLPVTPGAALVGRSLDRAPAAVNGSTNLPTSASCTLGGSTPVVQSLICVGSIGFLIGSRRIATHSRRAALHRQQRRQGQAVVLRAGAGGSDTKKNSDDVITAFDMEVAGRQSSLPARSPFASSGNERPAKTLHRPHVAESDDVLTAADLEASVATGFLNSERDMPLRAKPAGPRPRPAAPDGEVLPNIAEMDDVARADVIDDLTRKAVVLMEAGEISEATALFDKITRIADLFQELQTLTEQGRGPMSDEEFLKLKPEQEVLMQLRRELHKEDFSKIFGGQAKMAIFIGGW